MPAIRPAHEGEMPDSTWRRCNLNAVGFDMKGHTVEHTSEDMFARGVSLNFDFSYLFMKTRCWASWQLRQARVDLDMQE